MVFVNVMDKSSCLLDPFLVLFTVLGSWLIGQLPGHDCWIVFILDSRDRVLAVKNCSNELLEMSLAVCTAVKVVSIRFFMPFPLQILLKATRPFPEVVQSNDSFHSVLSHLIEEKVKALPELIAIPQWLVLERRSDRLLSVIGSLRPSHHSQVSDPPG